MGASGGIAIPIPSRRAKQVHLYRRRVGILKARHGYRPVSYTHLSSDVQAQREEALKAQLEEMKTRKRKLVDPLQFEMSIQAEDLTGYTPSFGWEMAPVSKKQKDALEKFGIFADEIENAGKAALIMDRLQKRRDAGLSTPKPVSYTHLKFLGS